MNVPKNELIQCYHTNEDFKNYIDKCVKTYGRDVDYMLNTLTARQYYLYITKQGEYKNE